IVQERLDLRLQTRLGVDLGYLGTVGLTSLMYQAQTRLMCRQQGRHLQHGLIEAMRSLTAAKDQQMQVPVGLSRLCGADPAAALGPRRTRILHRPARQIRCALRKRGKHALSVACQSPHRQSRDDVLLQNHAWYTQQRGSQHYWPHDIAASPYD